MWLYPRSPDEDDIESMRLYGVVERTWPAFFTLRDEDGDLHRIKLDDLPDGQFPNYGEIWEVHGKPFIDPVHRRFGWQVKAEQARMALPSGKILIDFLWRNFQGIGKPTADKLWYFAGKQGVDLFDVLNRRDASALEGIFDKSKRPVLARDLVRTVISQWQELRAETELVKWFMERNFPVRLARRAREMWGEDALDAIIDDPYRLLAFAKRGRAIKAFRSIDDLATSHLGVAADDPRRLVAAFESCMYQEYDNGHTAATLLTIHTRLNELLGSERATDAEILRLVDDDRGIELKDDESGTVLVQLRGIRHMEQTIMERLNQMLEADAMGQKSLFQPQYDPALLQEFEAKQPFPLVERQRQAIRMMLEKRVCVITGGAGVGKTTCLKGGYHQILAQGGMVIQMALTGKAVMRMKDGKMEVVTIAKFLLDVRKAAKQRGIPQNQVLPSNVTVVIDEMSMVDVASFYALLKALPEGCRLVLVGDPYQLPPINAGLTFHVIARSDRIPRVELTEVHRAMEETGIPKAGVAIRNQQVPTNMQAIKYDPDQEEVFPMDTGVFFVAAKQHEIPEIARRAYAELLDKEGNEAQILTGINISATGVKGLNIELQNWFAEGREYIKVGGIKYAEKDPVIFTENQAKRNLWNGSMGQICKVYGDEPKLIPVDDPDAENKFIEVVAEARFDGELHQLTLEDFEHIQLAYAITVHKSQGSAFERVVIICQDWPTVVDNTWFYTALTRARKQVVIIGDRTVFERHVTRPPRAFDRVIGFFM